MSQGTGPPKGFPPGAKCVVCRETLGLRALHAGGAYYHRDCFKCAGCSQQLDVRFFSIEGQSYCHKCYMDKFAAKCTECKKPLDGTLCVVMLDKEYHQTCPKCTKCRRSLAGGQYFPFENQPYCLECHWQLRIEASRQPKAPGTDPKRTK